MNNLKSNSRGGALNHNKINLVMYVLSIIHIIILKDKFILRLHDSVPIKSAFEITNI